MTTEFGCKHIHSDTFSYIKKTSPRCGPDRIDLHSASNFVDIFAQPYMSATVLPVGLRFRADLMNNFLKHRALCPLSYMYVEIPKCF